MAEKASVRVAAVQMAPEGPDKVAELLDQPEGTVKSRIRNGMRRMRAALVDAGIQGADR